MPREEIAPGTWLILLPFVPCEPAGIEHFSFPLSFPPPCLGRSPSSLWCHCFLPTTFWCSAQSTQTPQFRAKSSRKFDLQELNKDDNWSNQRSDTWKSFLHKCLTLPEYDETWSRTEILKTWTGNTGFLAFLDFITRIQQLLTGSNFYVSEGFLMCVQIPMERST